MITTNRQPRLTLREQKLRNKLIAQTWKKYKGDFTMLQIARIFRIPLGQFYKIVKKIEESKLLPSTYYKEMEKN